MSFAPNCQRKGMLKLGSNMKRCVNIFLLHLFLYPPSTSSSSSSSSSTIFDDATLFNKSFLDVVAAKGNETTNESSIGTLVRETTTTTLVGETTTTLVGDDIASAYSAIEGTEGTGNGSLDGILERNGNNQSINEEQYEDENFVLEEDAGDTSVSLETTNEGINNNNDTSNSLQDIVQASGGPRRFAYLMLSLTLFMGWVLFATFYNSRVVGKILTWVVNRLTRGAGGKSGGRFRPQIRIGSFSVSFLSGKILFRDVQIITSDVSYRVQDGFVIFMWWRKVKEWKKLSMSLVDTCFMQKSDTVLYIT